MMASREISREVDFIVTVNNETLELNSGALSCFSSEPETNTPIAFVSVIGQPMSRKTSLISQTLRYVRERAGVALGDAHSGFPNETDEKVSLLQHDDRQGVLMWTKPVWITNDDQMLGVCFLDIWMPRHEPEIYSKLVDFCIYVSSTVVLAEVAPVVQWHWKPESSFISSLTANQRVFQQLYIVIQEWECLRHEEHKTTFVKMCEEKDVDTSMANTFSIPKFLSQFFESWKVCFLPVRQMSKLEAEADFNNALTHLLNQITYNLVSLKRGNNIITTKTIASEFLTGIQISNDPSDALNHPFANIHSSGETAVSADRGIKENSFKEKELNDSFCILSLSDCSIVEPVAQVQEVSLPLVEPSTENMDVDHQQKENCANVEEPNIESQEKENYSDKMEMDKLDQCGFLASSVSADVHVNSKEVDIGADVLVTDHQPLSSENTPLTVELNSFENSRSEEAAVFTHDTTGLPNPTEEKYLDVDENHFSCNHGENSGMKISNESPLKTTVKSTVVSSYFPDHTGKNKPRSTASRALENLGPLLQDANKFVIDQQSSKSCSTEDCFCVNHENQTADCMDAERFVQAGVPKDFNTMSPKENQELQKNDEQSGGFQTSCLGSRIPGKAVALTPTNCQPNFRDVSKSFIVTKYYEVMKSQVVDITGNLGIYDLKLLPTTHLLAQELVLRECLKKYGKSTSLKDAVKDITDQEFRKYEEENTEKFHSHNAIIEVSHQRMNAIFDNVETDLLRQIASSPTDYSIEKISPDITNVVEEITRNLPVQWKKYFRGYLNNMKDAHIYTLKQMQKVVVNYRRAVLFRLNSSICFPPKEFSRILDELLKRTVINNKFALPTRKNIHEAYKLSIGMIDNDLFNFNENIYRNEQLAAKDVANTAFYKYQQLMEHKISGALMTDQCVNSFHTVYVDVVTQAFKNILNSSFKSTDPWETQLAELSKRLEAQLATFRKKNRDNLHKISKLRKKLLLDCETAYHDAMRSLQKPWKSPVEHFNRAHQESLSRAMKILKENTSQLNSELLAAWSNDVSSRLERIQRIYMEENRAKENPPKSSGSIPPTTPKQQDVAEKAQFGISLYFGVEEIRGEVYSSIHTSSILEFRVLPFIGFTSGGTVQIGNDAKYLNNYFNLYSLLQDSIQETSKAEKMFYYDGNPKSYCTLKVEGIFAVYFHWLRLQIEGRLQQKIESCVVAISGLFTSCMKQLLKASLRLAGFKRNLLIPNTTAMGLSYLKQTEFDGKDKPETILIVHHSRDSLEVASAIVSPTELKIRKLSGFIGSTKTTVKKQVANKIHELRLNEDEVERKFKHVLNEVIDKMSVRKAVVIFDMNSGNNEKITNAVQKKLRELKITEVKMNQLDIISLCATLDASRNTPELGSVFPVYLNVSPYSLSFEFNGDGPYTILKQHLEFLDDFRLNFPMDCKHFGTCSVTETFSLHNKEQIVDKYSFRHHESQGKVSVGIMLNSEGCCTIEAKVSETSEIARLITNAKFMIPGELKYSWKTLEHILMAEEKKYHPATVFIAQPAHPISPPKPGARKPLETVANSDSSNNPTVIPVVMDSTSEFKGKLARLVQDVKLKIESDNDATNPMIIEKINSTLKQCEELMAKPDVKSKQLELKLKILETFATKLVSSQ